MAALAQATKPATEAQTATSVDITQASSTKMVRNLCRATVGELLWLRGVLPPADFDETAFGGVTTHLPRSGTAIANWLEDGVFAALEGGFLRAVVLSLWQLPENSPSTEAADSAAPEGASLLESYIIRVTYSQDSQVHLSVEARSGSKFTRAGASRQAIALVRTLISLVNTLPQLPEADLLLSMRLYYYDELVPHDEEWAPKHFSDARDIMPERFTGESPVKLLAGSTETSFHKMAMSVAFQRDYVTAPAETSAAETPVLESSAHGRGLPVVEAGAAASRGGTAETATSRRPAPAIDDAADADSAREAKFQHWVDRVKAHVLATRTATVAALRQEFGNEIPPLMLTRVLDTLVTRNVLRRSGKRMGNAAQYRVLAMDLPAAADEKVAAAAGGAASPKSKDDGDMPRMLFSLATLVAWDKRGDFLTQAALAKQIGLGRKERDVSRALMRKLVDRDLLSTSTRGNQGREVHDSHRLRLAAEEASEWLKEKRMQGEASKRSLELVMPGDREAEAASPGRREGAPGGGAKRAEKRGRRAPARGRAASESDSDGDSDSDTSGARPRGRQRRSASESSGSDDEPRTAGNNNPADSSDDDASTADEAEDGSDSNDEEEEEDDEDYAASSARKPAAAPRSARRRGKALTPSQSSSGSVELRHRGGARARSVLGAAAASARRRALD